MFEKGERTRHYVWKWLFNLTVNVKKEQDKNKKMCSAKLWGVGHHSPQKNMTQKLLERKKLSKKLFCECLPSIHLFQLRTVSRHVNITIIISLVHSLSLSLISLSLPALSFSPQTHTRTKRNVR